MKVHPEGTVNVPDPLTVPPFSVTAEEMENDVPPTSAVPDDTPREAELTVPPNRALPPSTNIDEMLIAPFKATDPA